ncbi:MAG: hypothetical protein P8Q36_10385 [Alphaproteobacteria bacterium]|jgi:hypothetical protein|nr:hypothetical protein [Rhodospirillaceae bacterium]MDG2481256.1 hypothetical protein [Alphaproteobacteria bacterium]MBT6206373.1 hypothetical protein [Rhodospirillaceae bacterium]MBT6510280.1 hypothetical protein [Rhodospirillaceae bacterium]MBT7614534.1 hypothetical protein [Rhodospirillaceae bacterium]
MLRALLVMGFAVLFTVSAQAQFSDDSQSLFSEDPYEPKADNDLVIWEFTTADEEEGAGVGGAQSVEEICCGLSEVERAGQAICVDVELSCN